MKRITLSILLTTLAIATALAIPAKRGKFQHTQSDGTVVTYEIVGDEFNNRLVVDGLYSAISGEDGDLYYAINRGGHLVRSDVKVKPTSRMNNHEREVMQQSMGARKMVENPYFGSYQNSPERAIQRKAAALQGSAPHESALELGEWGGEIKGKRNMLVILVEYTDVKFSIDDPHTQFTNLLNQEGYAENGGTGSASDYFNYASSGQFEPVFDVVGPYTLSNNRKYYGGNDKYGDDQAPAIQAKEACELADANGVDFSKYDNDNDGKIDLVFVVYAGHNPAEGGPADAVWPHKWDVYPGYNIPESTYPRYDGKQFTVYACTSELKGYRGTNMTGIGSFCHEFSHAIGLPDWYDTENNVCFGMDFASIMHSGNYLNSSCTPPTYNILERWLVGWTLPKEIHSAGNYQISHVSTNDGYILWANEDKTECFLFEARTKAGGCKWDKYLNEGDSSYNFQGGEGLLVYHVDWTGQYYNRWVKHTINTDPNHQCATIFRSNPSATTENSKGWFFPGSRNVTTISYDSTPVFQNWAFERLPYYFDNIAIEGSTVTMRAMMKDLSIDARQYDALIDWEASDYTFPSWTVKYTNKTSGEEFEVTTTNKYILLSPLTTSTKYDAFVYGQGESEPTYEFNFETQSNAISPRSALAINAKYLTTDIVRLSVKNLSCTPEEILWYIDGKESPNCVKLGTGKYQVCAVITDTKGNTQYLYRYITVK